MTLHDVIHHLPETPPEGLWDWAETTVEFNTEYILFYQDTVAQVTHRDGPLDEIVTPRKGARCCCTYCGEVFETGWVSNPCAKARGIVITAAPNGVWAGYCTPEDEYALSIREWDTMSCPYCGTEAQLVHRSEMRNGRTFQIMLGNVDTIGPYAVIYTWLYRRRIHSDGTDTRDIRPAKAYVVTERGTLHQYNHVKQSSFGGTYDLPQWERACRVNRDPFLDLYYCYDASNGKQVGGRMWDAIPPLGDTTAEKTGLEEYLLYGGDFPVAYMQEWKKHPYIENLIKSAFGGQVVTDMDGQINHRMSYGDRSGRVHIEWADLSERRPCDQLGMTRREIRQLGEQWGVLLLENWADYRRFSAQMTATEYNRHACTIGEDALRKLSAYAATVEDKGWLDKAARYIAKQVADIQLYTTAAEELCDLWDMLNRREAAGDTIPPGDRWPKRLREAHDRESRRLKAKKDAKINRAFAKVVEKYGNLEWSDGELCIRLPRTLEELEREGKTLHHCVGSYGTRHAEEGAVVFFVRHYRRPERSYYTMDYSFGGRGLCRRNQLHGYGNERHGDHKQHSHSIPKKVTAFVERWEREVLAPWVAAQMAAQHKPEKKSA